MRTSLSCSRIIKVKFQSHRIHRYFSSFIDTSEGDINLSDLRTKWQTHNIDENTKSILKKDSDVFIHQALSSPCLNVVSKCKGKTVLLKYN